MAHSSESCEEVFALLSQYLDLELPSEACTEIERHLAGCPPCVQFAESLQKTVDLCRAYKPSVIPEPLSAAARKELQDAWQKALIARTRKVDR